ncbi:methenyltetrahydromethanopterin cyclohydrolase [Sporomusa sphaeroides]|uniref:methenyltetrahydromethanopterin cyclohydrolase n=1 Tax=Sporomusa sphaeroides TaxID=47679 RepID=UPI00202E7D33|nr:methenyltetrahydromethanopterin cyclohydrolase [Sporomusa sphaeroides]MCM0759199.1 methenyltetrahydromethanopterin cyclohydrolase [Sporomusa sphaeroides DSM 2875]HML35281.1 methenyltetrahydromethanopterin cyclohydrolase [Sporomusa sphaeroides]
MPVPQLIDIAALSPNTLALPMVRQLIGQPERFGVEVHLQDGVTIVDCGVHAPGGWEAGVLLASICLGGLAQVGMHWYDFDGFQWPAVEIATDHPVRACLAAQYAGWQIKAGKYFAMGSGPGRAVVGTEALFSQLGYQDSSKTAVFCLESGELPPPDAVKYIVEKCKRDPTDVYLLVAATASAAGSMQIAARSVETGLHKMLELGCDLGAVKSGWGICPVSPVASNPLSAIGRTNDAVLYGATVHYNFHCDDEQLVSLLPGLPSLSSADYGQPFEKIYQRYGDFYSIDPMLFSPAQVLISNLRSGRSFRAGKIRADILKVSFGLEQATEKS